MSKDDTLLNERMMNTSGARESSRKLYEILSEALGHTTLAHDVGSFLAEWKHPPKSRYGMIWVEAGTLLMRASPSKGLERGGKPYMVHPLRTTRTYETSLTLRHVTSTPCMSHTARAILDSGLVTETYEEHLFPYTTRETSHPGSAWTCELVLWILFCMNEWAGRLPTAPVAAVPRPFGIAWVPGEVKTDKKLAYWLASYLGEPRTGDVLSTLKVTDADLVKIVDLLRAAFSLAAQVKCTPPAHTEAASVFYCIVRAMGIHQVDEREYERMVYTLLKDCMMPLTVRLKFDLVSSRRLKHYSGGVFRFGEVVTTHM
jgi:hypothetical protein